LVVGSSDYTTAPNINTGNILFLPEKFTLLKYVMAVIGCLGLPVHVLREHTATA
jgi:hypothetical protein